MSPTQLIASRLTATGDLLKTTLADFTDAEMLARPAPGANHAAWQLGHLAASEAKMVAESSGMPPTALPPGFAEKFSKDAAGSDDASRFPRKSELLDVFTKVRQRSIEWVNALKPEQLSDPSPERLRNFVPTLGQLAIMNCEHAAMHVGQFQVIRRKLGKPVLF
jgi:hypothetical protein